MKPEGIAEKTSSALRTLYTRDERPWVVAFSGGKDSTLLVQLVYNMLMELGSRVSKPVFIISTDTRVEAPNIEEYLTDAIRRMQAFAEVSDLPISVKLVRPEPNEGFWQLAHKFGRSPSRWEGAMATDTQDDVLEELLVDSPLSQELIQSLLRLAYEYHPNLDNYGKKIEFERAIRETIERAMDNVEET
ncbi:MAG: hypothetical protein H7833_20120 [Magnetococcus sp. DMHC-1]|nr:hypothetical protein [Magnetococcales bacterium]